MAKLTKAGHEVHYFSFEKFREQLEMAGALFISCDGYDVHMQDASSADRVGKDKVFATQLLISATLALDEMTSTMIEQIKPDIIVSDSVAFWGKLVAMKYALPFALETVLSEPRYKKNATKISESFKLSGGAAEARDFLERVTRIK